MSSPDDGGGSDAAGSTSSNYTLLYIIGAVLAGVILYVVIRYGRSVLAEWRELQAGQGRGAAGRFGLSADEIDALPTFTYRVRAASASPYYGRRRSSKGRGTAGAVECVVCLQELEDGDVVRVLPPCRHFFHTGCIDLWLRGHTSCPVCRADLLDPELGEVAAVSPPLPQLRRCGVSPERPSSASRVLADILAARSPLRSPSSTPGGYTRVDDQWTKTRPSPENAVVRSSKTPSPLRFTKHSSPSPRRSIIGVLDSTEVITSASSAPVVPEVVIARSVTPSPTRMSIAVAGVESMEAITMASPSPVPVGEGGGGSLSKASSPLHIQIQ